MKPAVFDYVAPDSLAAAVEALAVTTGRSTKVLAGGQSLVPMLNLRTLQPSTIIDITGIAGLDAISFQDDVLTIGALVRQRTAERSSVVRTACPLMSEAIPLIGNPAVRNQGTVGGSIAHSDPAAELPTVAVCLDAEILAFGPDGERVIPAGEFFIGRFQNCLSAGEVLTGIRVPAASPGTGAAYAELSRKHNSGAMAGVAAVVRFEGEEVEEVRIAIAGLGQTPIRAHEAEAALVGRALTDAAIVEAASAATEGLMPTSDQHASAAYRIHLAGVLIRRTLTTAATRARENK